MTDDELRHWQEVDHHLAELTRHAGWGALVEFSDHRMRSTKERLLNGHAKDHDVYLKDTGWLRGIHDTLDAHKAVKAIVDLELTRRRELESAIAEV